MLQTDTKEHFFTYIITLAIQELTKPSGGPQHQERKSYGQSPTISPPGTGVGRGQI